MEKYNLSQLDSEDSRSSGDYEKMTFLNKHFVKETRGSRGMLWLSLLNLFFFMLSAMTLVCAVFSQRSTSTHSAAQLMNQFGLTSPAMHVVEYHKQKFELPNPLNSSKYVGVTDRVKNAWTDVTYLPEQMISTEDFPKLQMPETSLKVTDPKTGETGYRVGLEVFHQLQCLNMLRMASYPDYYQSMASSDVNNRPEVVRGDLDNCIEILRMNLMCLSDINVFTFHEVPGRKGAWPQYESQHVCRNFDAIKKWANDHAMPKVAI